MANEVFYSVDITLTEIKTGNIVSFCFRNNLPLEQAVDLARSIWLSTTDSSVAVYVRSEDSNVASVTFRARE